MGQARVSAEEERSQARRRHPLQTHLKSVKRERNSQYKRGGIQRSAAHWVFSCGSRREMASNKSRNQSGFPTTEGKQCIYKNDTYP